MIRIKTTAAGLKDAQASIGDFISIIESGRLDDIFFYFGENLNSHREDYTLDDIVDTFSVNNTFHFPPRHYRAGRYCWTSGRYCRKRFSLQRGFKGGSFWEVARQFYYMLFERFDPIITPPCPVGPDFYPTCVVFVKEHSAAWDSNFLATSLCDVIAEEWSENCARYDLEGQ